MQALWKSDDVINTVTDKRVSWNKKYRPIYWNTATVNSEEEHCIPNEYIGYKKVSGAIVPTQDSIAQNDQCD